MLNKGEIPVYLDGLKNNKDNRSLWFGWKLFALKTGHLDSEQVTKTSSI